MIPTTLTNSVFRIPTKNARPYVSEAVYGTGLSPISKPARRSRNAKLTVKPRSAIAVVRLLARYATSRPTPSRTATCTTTRRTRTSRHGGTAWPRCSTPDAAVMPSASWRVRGERQPRPGRQLRLSVWRCVEEAAIGPERVGSALQLEAGARPEVAVVDFAVVADRADHVDHPVGF